MALDITVVHILILLVAGTFILWSLSRGGPALPDERGAYTEWPPPRDEQCRRALRALNLAPTPLVETVNTTRLVVAAKRAATKASSPPVLVIAGADLDHGLGNVFNLLVEASVLARAVGGACIYSYGANYAAELELGPMPVFPCRLASLGALEALRAQSAVARLDFKDWRAGAAAGLPVTAEGLLPPAAPLVIDLGGGGEDCTRNDVMQEWAPPGMGPAQFWPRLRAAYEELVLRTNDKRVPVRGARPAPVDFGRPGTGTICGHMRMLRREIRLKGSGRPASCGPASDCGDVLYAMNEMHRAHAFASFVYVSPVACDHCVGRDAPDLARDAENLRPRHANQDAAISGRGRKRTPASAHGDALGAFRDMSLLASCDIVVGDDPEHNTFMETAAAAGGLTPCKHPLAWILDRKPAYPYAFPDQYRRLVDVRSKRVVGTIDQTRVLCRAGDPGAPPKRSAWQRCGMKPRWVEYNVTTPWVPTVLRTTALYPAAESNASGTGAGGAGLAHRRA